MRAAAIWTALVPVALLLSGCEDVASPPAFLAPTEVANSTNSSTDSTGWCTEEDKRRMDELGYGNDDGSLGGHLYRCTKSNINWMLQVDEGNMKECVKGDVGLSDGCAACFAYTSTMGVQQCKMDCMGSWCSGQCQECNERTVSSAWVELCTGYAIPRTQPC